MRKITGGFTETLSTEGNMEKKQILHDLKRIAVAVQQLIDDLDEVSRELDQKEKEYASR